MVEMAKTSLEDADIVLFMIDAEDGFINDDKEVFEKHIRPYRDYRKLTKVILTRG